MSNEELIHHFYTSFSVGDFKGMAECYHDNIVFEDPAFGVLKGPKPPKMWEMLISRVGDQLKVTYDNVKVNGPSGSASWIAVYPYGPKKRQVTNNISAQFEFQNGKIIKHTDSFDMWKWSKQALGLPGLLLGWTPLIKNKVQQQANKGLDAFMKG